MSKTTSAWASDFISIISCCRNINADNIYPTYNEDIAYGTNSTPIYHPGDMVYMMDNNKIKRVAIKKVFQATWEISSSKIKMIPVYFVEGQAYPVPQGKLYMTEAELMQAKFPSAMKGYEKDLRDKIAEEIRQEQKKQEQKNKNNEWADCEDYRPPKGEKAEDS